MVDGVRRNLAVVAATTKNRNKEIERVARLARRQWRSPVAALIVPMIST